MTSSIFAHLEAAAMWPSTRTLRDLVKEEKELSLVKIRLEVMSRQPVWYVREACWDPLLDCICRDRMEDRDTIEYHLHSNDSSDTKENISLSQTQSIQFHLGLSSLHSCCIARNLVLEVSRKGLKMTLIDWWSAFPTKLCLWNYTEAFIVK